MLKNNRNSTTGLWGVPPCSLTTPKMQKAPQRMEFGAKRCLLIWYLTTSGWWFGTFLCSIICGIILPIDFHIFQDGYWTTNQTCLTLIWAGNQQTAICGSRVVLHTTATAAPLYIFPNMFPECSHHFAMMFPTLPHSDPNLFLTFSQCFPNLSTHFPTIFTMIRHKECGSKSSISHPPF